MFGRPLGDWGTYDLDLRADSEARRAHHQPRPTAPVDEAPAPAEAERPTADLPALDLAVGDAVQASVIGAATVTHVLAYPDGTRLAVARSRVGEQLLRPGTYTRADLSAAAPTPTPPAPLPAPVDVSSPVSASSQTLLPPSVMPHGAQDAIFSKVSGAEVREHQFAFQTDGLEDNAAL
ncbi:hypothetical protein [Deinococcus soli (ex Cha et al. 2016)]|uniref:Uncharacterized protein n=1 Tax=Deinococcus soli (ex Cha et al. 2016) TaxID=1309411 RepID=A0ACC6KNN8_9DEIO|nr:hypothetical protein [Deinococcus soli (ex Cha et al. 2016)]MDR6330697.1 hypothetical protein [Deinococcus soli (ex Cha et al. 2016)]MDR6754064.1 hypothetical protein [Deinococcus soli (ex Cha et al. 2016)]